MTLVDSETHEFTMSPALLRTMILRQAGSLSKAILEGVMNGVDAGADRIDVEIDRNQLVIRDNGKGMTSRREIEAYFQRFGAPHSADEKKVFGEFRMGRGQLFAFGVNSWRTGPFRMRVDANPNVKGEVPLAFDLEVHSDEVRGCEITVDLFKTRSRQAIVDLRDRLQRELRYLDADVRLNGERITTPLDDIEWDYVTEDAYFLWRNDGRLRWYNLGVFVMERGSYQYGVAAHVVSRRKLQVNFARNDVIEDDPAVRRILKTLRKHGRKERDKARNQKRSYRDYEIRRIVLDLKSGQPEMSNAELRKVPMLTDINQRRLSPSTLASRIRGRTWPTLTLWDGNEPIWKGQRAHDHRISFVLHPSVGEEFEARSADEVLDRLEEYDLLDHWLTSHAETVTPQDVAPLINSKKEVIPDKDLRDKDLMLLKAIREAYPSLQMHQDEKRKVIAGKDAGNDRARAWTDGKSYIALTLPVIRMADRLEGLASIGLLLVHEQTHSADSTISMEHTPEFYQEFHDTVLDRRCIGRFVRRGLAALTKHIHRFNRKMTKAQARMLDAVEEADQAGALLNGRAPQPNTLSEKHASTNGTDSPQFGLDL